MAVLIAVVALMPRRSLAATEAFAFEDVVRQIRATTQEYRDFDATFRLTISEQGPGAKPTPSVVRARLLQSGDSRFNRRQYEWTQGPIAGETATDSTVLTKDYYAHFVQSSGGVKGGIILWTRGRDGCFDGNKDAASDQQAYESLNFVGAALHGWTSPLPEAYEKALSDGEQDQWSLRTEGQEGRDLRVIIRHEDQDPIGWDWEWVLDPDNGMQVVETRASDENNGVVLRLTVEYGPPLQEGKENVGIRRAIRVRQEERRATAPGVYAGRIEVIECQVDTFASAPEQKIDLSWLEAPRRTVVMNQCRGHGEQAIQFFLDGQLVEQEEDIAALVPVSEVAEDSFQLENDLKRPAMSKDEKPRGTLEPKHRTSGFGSLVSYGLAATFFIASMIFAASLFRNGT